ncbi:hypothetical protein QTQ03_17925 [Micromonospora sp. WMMA1363]|uniref:hypothetical protein n=1 Tax=Micromonospora sp. WMMA1363 TaxID=3053985 RepID=UPI00259C688C|nr:hypothetical protein [Micromonospora sp. WMMA1363]MDM4721389.1 hypothetical protein [Micromonospora sp. WMMA1363]
MSIPQAPRTTGTLMLQVLGRVAPCPRCAHQMLWVLALLPVARPRPGEFVKVDQEGALALAEEILRGADQDIVARRLQPRPSGSRGASFNPNTCTGCGAQADWHDFDAVVDASIYHGQVEVARGRVGVRDWRRAVAAQHTVICWLPER